MRMELQFSFRFLADYLAGKVTAALAKALPVGTTFSPAQYLTYKPASPPAIVNNGPGKIRVPLKFGAIFPELQLDLGADLSGGQLQLTGTLANRDAILVVLDVLKIDHSLVPLSISAPLDLSKLLPGLHPAPTQAAFAADVDSKVIALRVELGAATASDDVEWALFTANHVFTPAFHPQDITADPPREWAAAIDWQLLQPLFAAQIEQQAAEKLTKISADAKVTGAFQYAWGLNKGEQPAGFADGWPLDGSGNVDLDVTCPIYISGHDGHGYSRISFESSSRNLMLLKLSIIGHVSCCWTDTYGDFFTHSFGGFGFDGNALMVDLIRTDHRAMLLRGEAIFSMPLLFPTPQVQVDNFSWVLLDACKVATRCQAVGIYLTDTTIGIRTPLLGRLKITAPCPYKIEAIPAADSQGISVGPIAWGVYVAQADVPASGGSITVSVETNAGTPSFGSSTSVTVPFAPPLTEAEELDMDINAAMACKKAKAMKRVVHFIPEPPEEIIWWLTQEMLITPAQTLTGTPIVTRGPTTRTAVGRIGLRSAMRLNKEDPHGIVQHQSIGPAGVRIIVTKMLRGR
jgi:hypothetical protein